MEKQDLLVTPNDHPLVRFVIAFFLIAIACYNAWHFAAAGSWIYMAALGLAPPLIALLEWYWLRQRSAEARIAADRLIWLVLLTALGVAV